MPVKKKKDLAVMVHAYNSSTQEAESEGLSSVKAILWYVVSYKPAWATEGDLVLKEKCDTLE